MSNTKLSADEVKHVAKLANLPLTEKETTQFGKQLSETIDYIHDLEEVDTKNVVPTSQVTGKTNEFREDEITVGLTQEQALKNGSKTQNGLFVSKITWN